MENSLKNRYIYAVVRHLPMRMQKDVEMELDAIISEMLDERKGNSNTSTEQDLKDVLAELGKPEELALKYGGNERKALISGVYFLMYKRVLLIVLPIVASVLAVLTTIGFFIGDGPTISIILPGFVSVNYLSHVVQIFSVTIGGVVQAFAGITIIFAILDYKKVSIQVGDFFDLPEIPEARMKISPYEPIIWMAFSIVTTIVFLGFPHLVAGHFGGGWVTVFNVEVVRGLWLPVLLWMLVEIVAEAIKLVEGQYTMRLVAMTVVTSLLQMVCAIIVFGNRNIINSEFVSSIENLGSSFGDGGWFITNIARPNLVILVVIFGILVWEVVEVAVMAVQARR